MSLSIEDSDTSYEALVGNTVLSEGTRRTIAAADVLILPENNVGDFCFYETTPDFYKLFKREVTGVNVALYAEPGKEQIVTLRSFEILLPTIFASIDPVKDVLIPSIINFAATYIFYKYAQEASENKLKIKFSLVVEDKKTKKTKRIRYEGDIEGLKALKIDAKELFKEK